MTLSADLRRIADHGDMYPRDRASLRRAADALTWRRVEDGLPEPISHDADLNDCQSDPVLTWNGSVMTQGRATFTWYDGWHLIGWATVGDVAEPTHYMPLPPEPEPKP